MKTFLNSELLAVLVVLSALVLFVGMAVWFGHVGFFFVPFILSLVGLFVIGKE